MSDLLVPVADIETLGTALMERMGTPEDLAVQVGRSLASANACGHDSHGLIRLPWYAGFVPDGRAVPTARARVERRTGGTAAVDGQHGWGQPAANLAVDVASELAARVGLATVTVRACNHVGRLGEYAETLAGRGLISILWCNADPSVAPFGGRQRMLGTDPFAAGIPTGDDAPVIVDFATAAVAEGKLRLERLAGRAVAPGLIQDQSGHPSTDPEDFYAGGALLPFGGHKGYGLAVLVELLGGALSGNAISFLPEYAWGNGMVLIAIDPARFVAPDAFTDQIVRAATALRTSPPAVGFDRVRMPGDVEREVRATRLTAGVPVPDSTRAAVVDLAAELGLDPLPFR